MFFDSWYDLVRILIVGSCAYIGLVFFLRVTGKRTLSKMNAFDLVVTVALGSTFAATLLNSDVSLTEGLAAFALLCALQYAVAFLSVRSKRFQHLVKAEPTLLFHRGAFLATALRKERVAREEIIAALRAEGAADLEDVTAVVLETDGSFSVVTGNLNRPAETLRNVEGAF
jgi:uncharacterized membrane protein YcaP (DUF421 family)